MIVLKDIFSFYFFLATGFLDDLMSDDVVAFGTPLRAQNYYVNNVMSEVATPPYFTTGHFQPNTFGTPVQRYDNPQLSMETREITRST